MNTAESSQLIEKCLAGDEQAIENLVRAYETNVFRLALSIVGDASTANEVMQETFIAALRSLRSYKEKSSLKAWLYTITLNISRSHLRKQKVLEKLRINLASILQVDAQKQSSPEDSIIQSEKERAIWTALHKLDDKHRMVVVLRYFQNLSVSEIAEILSVNEGTIHSRLHTARERLRNVLEKENGD